jgi:hypothetical protein
VARWTASAKWAEGPALDGRRATLLGLGLNEGLGISALSWTAGCSVLRGIVLVAPRYGKSELGTHRERHTATALAGTLG